MKTRITEYFGIEHPIIQGGMHYVGSNLSDTRSGFKKRTRHCGSKSGRKG